MSEAGATVIEDDKARARAEEVVQVPAPASTDHDSRRGGLAWSHELDLAQLLAAVGAAQLGGPGDEDAAAEEAAAMATAAEAGVPPRDLTGVVADQLPPGPALAGCLSGADPAALSEWDLPGVAAAFRRLAGWAQAGELAAVAEMASRTAARDDHVRVDADGRPDQVTPAAASTVGLELVMSHPAAMAWTSLGVTLRWRLAATLAALSAGTIDLYRARLIAEATGPLDDDTARAVESAVLPGAGGQTSGQLRVALRRAVIAADPEGAEQRRKDAQRHAKVSLYPDPDADTATLAGTRLPAVHAAAAMARLTAIARAMKSAGMRGGLDYLRAIAFVGLLLGTLPLVPPPAGDLGPAGPTDPDPGPPGDPGDGGSGRDGAGRGDPGPGDADSAGSGPGGPGGPDADRPDDPGDSDEGHPDEHRPGEPALPDDEPADEGPPDPGPPADPGDACEDDEDDEDDGPFAPDPPTGWPPIPGPAGQIPPVLGQPPGHPPPASNSPPTQPPPASRPPPPSRPPPRGQSGRPPPGLLDLVISWRALNGDPAGPATLSRIGPITGTQARLLALTAAADPHARWQVILTDPDGYAIATETIRRRHRQGRAGRAAGVTGQVTVTIPAATLDQLARPDGPVPARSGIRAAVLRAARRALAHARRQAAADAAAPGGCAHTTATPAYRSTAKIRDHVTARDQTCRNPRCRQPARHADLDHTTPYDQGGRTCGCNLGGHCRTHHKIKQLPGWTLTQPRPGHFRLTTPGGRTYTTTPDPYPT
jgi:hypothetical protein